jgi:hypothetical protein
MSALDILVRALNAHTNSRWQTHPGGNAPQVCLKSRIARLAAEARSHKSAKLAETVEVTISGWVTTVAPSLFSGALRFVFPGPHTLPVGRQRGPFQRGMP